MSIFSKMRSVFARKELPAIKPGIHQTALWQALNEASKDQFGKPEIASLREIERDLFKAYYAARKRLDAAVAGSDQLQWKKIENHVRSAASFLDLAYGRRLSLQLHYFKEEDVDGIVDTMEEYAIWLDDAHRATSEISEKVSE